MVLYNSSFKLNTFNQFNKLTSKLILFKSLQNSTSVSAIINTLSIWKRKMMSSVQANDTIRNLLLPSLNTFQACFQNVLTFYQRNRRGTRRGKCKAGSSRKKAEQRSSGKCLINYRFYNHSVMYTLAHTPGETNIGFVHS